MKNFTMDSLMNWLQAIAAMYLVWQGIKRLLKGKESPNENPSPQESQNTDTNNETK